ncbi:hypothetical protein [Microbulbifer sp. TYP-18]|uniref:hypothetical protein n=1 Tax=Microbulbifer sp. TYP-18 TaxID=3230024 RepID=UPI0034C5B409
MARKDRKAPKASVEKRGLIATLFKGQPDPFKPGVLVRIETKTLRVLESDRETVTFNVDGMPSVWKRVWLNNYDSGHIFILPQ